MHGISTLDRRPPMNQSPVEIVFGIIFSLFGLCATAGGLLIVRSVFRKLRTWETLPGTVVGYQENSFGKRFSYQPQVQFLARDGRMLTFCSPTGSNRKPYGIGASVNVIYPPGDPSQATLKSFTNLGILPTFALGFGVAFTSLGLALILGEIK
jgi:hypothetical protein